MRTLSWCYRFLCNCHGGFINEPGVMSGVQGHLSKPASSAGAGAAGACIGARLSTLAALMCSSCSVCKTTSRAASISSSMCPRRLWVRSGVLRALPRMPWRPLNRRPSSTLGHAQSSCVAAMRTPCTLLLAALAGLAVVRSGDAARTAEPADMSAVDFDGMFANPGGPPDGVGEWGQCPPAAGATGSLPRPAWPHALRVHSAAPTSPRAACTPPPVRPIRRLGAAGEHAPPCARTAWRPRCRCAR